MNNLYIDLSRKAARENWVSLSQDDSLDDGYFKILEGRFQNDKKLGEQTMVDIDMLRIVTDQLTKLRDRILFKLKTYIDGYTILMDDEIEYLKQKSKIDDVKTFISANLHNNKAGMRDKDICVLMDIKKGSLNTTYQRVRKEVVETYKIKKAKNV